MEYSELIKDFLDDAEGHLDSFDGALLALEKDGYSRDIVLGTMGSLHTLKGNSGMMGFDSLKRYVHHLEDILKKVNDNEVAIERVIDILLNGANALRDAVRKIGENPAFKPDMADHMLDLRRILSGGPEGPSSNPGDLSAYLGSKTDTLKVDFKRLDHLLNLVGELVIYKTRLNQIERRIRGVIDNKSLVRELNDGLDLVGKTISGLQEGIMKARMLPVSNVFHKFSRMVRDISRAQGKEIRLIFEGGDTEIDKTIIDELEEPLLHIIRNAVDHGIELPEERILKGKDRQGVITLSAAQESSYVVIKAKDDGKGIDYEQVRETAIKKGLIKPEDVLDRDAVLSLIFSAGFSTKREADEISGRGIGLDVVSRNISKLNGQISVEGLPGGGTTFTIRLPLSLAIIPALMAEAGGEVYAIPISAVDESIKVKEEDIHVINNREVIRFREKVMPVVRLNDFFGLERKETGKFYLIILGRAEKRIAIAVDKLRGQQEIVIKPLDDTFGKSFGVAGASILGDGRIVLIIDAPALWNKKAVKSEM